MSVTCGFFNSVNNDRTYNATHMSQLFDGIINDGVYMGYGGHFAVSESATPSLTVSVASGRAWFNHTWTLNDSTMFLTLDQTYTGRCDAIVIHVDTSEAVRANSIIIKKGTEGSPSVKPTLVNEGDIHEYPLCYITIPSTNVIAQSAIENKIGSSATPYVTGIIDTIDTDDLIAQWQSEWEDYKEDLDDWFDDFEAEANAWASGFEAESETAFTTWFNHMKDQLSTDAAGHLQLEIDNLSDELDAVWDAFEGCTTVFNQDGSITQTYSNRIKVTTFNNDGSITETLKDKTTQIPYRSKTTTFNNDGSITEVVTDSTS